MPVWLRISLREARVVLQELVADNTIKLSKSDKDLIAQIIVLAQDLIAPASAKRK